MFKSGGGNENSEDDDFENAHFDSRIVLEHFQKKSSGGHAYSIWITDTRPKCFLQKRRLCQEKLDLHADWLS
jgi:hypothetical protein